MNLNVDNCIFTDGNDLECKCRELLDELQLENSICVALTDTLLSYFSISLRYKHTYNLDEERQIYMQIEEGYIIDDVFNSPTPVTVKIDPVTELIQFKGVIRLSFYKDTKFATCEATFSVNSKPNLNADYLEFINFQIQITVGNFEIQNQNIIDEEYGGTDLFKNYVDTDIIQPMDGRNQNSSELNDIIPGIVNIIDLPDDWRYIEGVTFNFMQFYYRDVQINGMERGCIFIVFTVQSSNLTPECLSENIMGSETIASLDTRRWAAIGITQGAMSEIIKPYIDIVIHETPFQKKGLGIRAEADYWVNLRLSNFKITDNGFYCDLGTISAGGSAYVAQKVLGEDRYKHSVSVKVELQSSFVEFQNFKLLPMSEDKFTIIAQPKVEIGHIEFTVDPDILEIDWFVNIILNGLKSLFENIITNKISFKLIKKPKFNYYEVELIGTRFYADSSVVLFFQMLNTDL
ncbi:hypothetical protein [Paenibacillus sp. sgz500992]|uniref:hypothetical protein n=1 Tax=Paenibacillus sp. sgz500992 TaxID=3242476 RepID=UPI0036D240F9